MAGDVPFDWPKSRLAAQTRASPIADPTPLEATITCL